VHSPRDPHSSEFLQQVFFGLAGGDSLGLSAGDPFSGSELSEPDHCLVLCAVGATVPSCGWGLGVGKWEGPGFLCGGRSPQGVTGNDPGHHRQETRT